MSRAATTADLGRATTARPRRRVNLAWTGTLPFFAYVSIFLILPTLIVVVGAFRTKSGAWTLHGIHQVMTPLTLTIFWTSLWLSALTALIGAVVGGVVAYFLSVLARDGVGRKAFVALNSVLAQFGGVMLAFAFVATLGVNGLLTRLLKDLMHVSVSPGLLSSMTGIVMVYCYFQIPLMIIVFLPAVDGLRESWREATATLGGTTWDYWRCVAGPILAPSFCGAFLLLFTNAFSAFATAAALISQQTIIVPMEIESAIRNENNLGMDAYAQALALGMIIVIAIVMTCYALLQRRSSRWLGEG